MLVPPPGIFHPASACAASVYSVCAIGEKHGGREREREREREKGGKAEKCGTQARSAN